VFGTLIAKEILETVLDFRFAIITVLFLVLIPLGMYVGREDYERRLANYQREHQMSVAVNLSRLSPVSCYTYLVSSLSGTGTAAPDAFIRNAERYQDQAKRAIYDNFVIKRYGGTHGGTAISGRAIEGFDESKASIPDMEYQYTTPAEALRAGWTDAFLRVVFAVLFSAVAFVRFNKYDVR